MTTLNYSAIADLHNLQITTAHAKSLPFCSVFTSRSLVTAFNTGDFSASALMSLLNLLFTDSLTTLSTLAPIVLLITAHGPRRKHRSLLYSNRFRGNISVMALLSNGCIYLLAKNPFPSNGCCFVVSRSLPSNGSMYYFICGHGIAEFENSCFMVSPAMVVGGRGAAVHEAAVAPFNPSATKIFDET
jgi:hypothetical protein